MAQSPIEKMQGPLTLAPKGQIQGGGGQPRNEATVLARELTYAGVAMVGAFQTKLEVPHGIAGAETAARAANDSSLATRPPQRETDLIMEALLREYLHNSPKMQVGATL